MMAFQRPEITFRARSAGNIGRRLMGARILTSWCVSHELVGRAFRLQYSRSAASKIHIVGRAMKAVQISRFGGPEVLQFVEAPTPVPRAGQILVRLRAIGVNLADTLTRMDRYA